MVRCRAYILTRYPFLILNIPKADSSWICSLYLTKKYGLWDRMDNGKNCERILALFHYFAFTGCFRFISASGKQVAAEAIISGIYDIRIEDDVLKFYENQALYRDQPIQGESFKPVAFQAEHRFYSKDGKLHYEYDGKCFDVDTKTMQRFNSPDIFPPFISVEK